MAKLPYYKMYPADADSDERYRLMTMEERGLYWTLLNLAWVNDGLPFETVQLAQLVGLPETDLRRLWRVVGECFFLDGKRMRNKRQEDERAKAIRTAEKRSEAGKAGASAKWRSDGNCHNFAIANDQQFAIVRAYDSISLSESDIEKEKLKRELQKSEGAGQVLAELEDLYLRAGVPVPVKHQQLALQLLLSIGPEKVSHVPRYVRHMLDSGRWSSAKTTKGLLNLLRDGDWDVPIVERSIPPPVNGTGRKRHAIDEMLEELRQERES